MQCYLSLSKVLKRHKQSIKTILANSFCDDFALINDNISLIQNMNLEQNTSAIYKHSLKWVLIGLMYGTNLKPGNQSVML